MQLYMLKRFSLALNHDFFADYSQSLDIKKKETKSTSESDKLLEEKNTEIESLKKEIAYLKQINDLLMKK